MRILITGAGGRIGSALARILLADDHEVRGFGLESDAGLADIAEATGLEAHYGDLGIPESLEPAVAGVDVICHLAAALTTHDVADDLYVKVNYVGTYNLLEAARTGAPDISRFLYTSSDAVYWPALTGRPLYLPIDEHHPLIAGSVYGATKVGAEAMCRAYWRTYQIPYTVIRPTATAAPTELLDPNSPFGRRWFLQSAIRWLDSHPRGPNEDQLLARLQTLDDGKEKLLLLTDNEGASSSTMITDARDVARAMALSIFSPDASSDAFNVGPEAPHSDRQLVEALSSALGLEVVEVDYAAVRPSWYVSSAKARQVFGYRPERSVFDMVDEAMAERS